MQQIKSSDCGTSSVFEERAYVKVAGRRMHFHEWMSEGIESSGFVVANRCEALSVDELRVWFSGQAIHAFVDSGKMGSPKEAAEYCVNFADAMIELLFKRKTVEDNLRKNNPNESLLCGKKRDQEGNTTAPGTKQEHVPVRCSLQNLSKGKEGKGI